MPDPRRLRSAVRTLRSLPGRVATAALEGAVRRAAARGPAAVRPPDAPRSLFVLRNNDLGDLLVVTPLFEALRRRFPEARIAAGVGDWSREVLLHNPWVSEVLAVNAPWFNKYAAEAGPLGRWAYLRRAEVREIARRRFDIGIDVLGSAWGALLLLRSEIPWRMGVRGYAGGASGLQAAVAFDPALHVGRAALRFAEVLGATDLPPVRPQIFLTPGEADEAERWWATADRGSRRRRVVIAPGGGLASRCWPAESWIALARGLAGRTDLSVLVLTGPREREIAAAVTAACPGARTHAEPPSLRRVFALLSGSELVLCNSSMPLHAAAAFSRRAVVLLGPSFSSARAHQAQWGYPGLSLSLGREAGERESLYSPGEALDIAREELAV
jgi:ADP-heptose:LPS heptosyltransferase